MRNKDAYLGVRVAEKSWDLRKKRGSCYATSRFFPEMLLEGGNS